MLGTKSLFLIGIHSTQDGINFNYKAWSYKKKKIKSI